ncbi:MAG: hypothetical protein VCD00_16750 [Candidatus Hydrogenedentota bacterium]
MRALLASLMIVLAVGFAGCSGDDAGDDAVDETPAAEETTDEG